MDLLVEGSLFSIPAATWLGFLIELIIKGFVIAFAAGLTIFLLRRAPSFIKSGIWTVVFLLLVLCPVLLALAPVINPADGRLSGSAVRVIQVADPETPDYSGLAVKSVTGNIATSRPEKMISGAVNDGKVHTADNGLTVRLLYLVAAMLVWLCVAVTLTIRVFRRLLAGRTAGSTAGVVLSGPVLKMVRETEARLSIGKPVEVRIGGDVVTPFVSGIFSFRLFLPEGISRWDSSSLSNIVTHELAHVKRGDLARLLLSELACAIHWFNPLVWRAARRAELQIEMACDDIVCQGHRGAIDYARQLVWFARQATAGDRSARVPGMAGKPGLEVRVKNIIHPSRRPGACGFRLGNGLLRFAVVLVVPALILALLVPVAGVQSRRPFDSETIAIRQVVDKPETVPAAKQPSATVHEAAAIGDLNGLTAILNDKPFLLDATDKMGMTPVALAAWNDHYEIVEYLIERGADLDLRNHNGLTPLFCALDRGRRETAQLLIAGGADLSGRGYRGRSLLHMAARTGYVDIIQFLIDRGADINATDVDGYTPLDRANHHKKSATADLLIGHGGLSSGIAPPPGFKPKNKKRV